MALEKMEKFLALTVPKESLHPDDVLEEWAESRVLGGFQIDRIEENPTAVESSTLISASLFNKGGRVHMPSVVTAEWFHENIIAGPPGKYFDALGRRRQVYAKSRMRLYLSSNLEELIPWFFDLGFDEVMVMARDKTNFMPGMLWRYLPMAEQNYDWVVCTGVDSLWKLGRELEIPHHSSSASLHPARFWMPFAGPIAIRPAMLGGSLDMPAALSGFAKQWNNPDLRTFAGQVLKRCRQGNRARYCDAGFLSLAFWNRRFLAAHPRLFLLGVLEFAHTCIAPIRLMDEAEEE